VEPQEAAHQMLTATIQPCPEYLRRHARRPARSAPPPRSALSGKPAYRLRAAEPVLDHARVDESAGWDDPGELRIRLDIALEQIAELTAENAQLRRRLNLPPCDAATEAPPQPAEQAVPSQTPAGTRTDYAGLIHRLTAVSAQSQKAAMVIARSGLTSLYDRMVLIRDGTEHPLRRLALHDVSSPFRTETVHGAAAAVTELRVPYRGAV
jgi:hypothetical protein